MQAWPNLRDVIMHIPYCGACCAPGLSVLAALVLCAHLVLPVLAAHGICVVYCGAWSAPGAVYELAICIVGC